MAVLWERGRAVLVGRLVDVFVGRGGAGGFCEDWSAVVVSVRMGGWGVVVWDRDWCVGDCVRRLSPLWRLFISRGVEEGTPSGCVRVGMSWAADRGSIVVLLACVSGWSFEDMAGSRKQRETSDLWWW